MKTKGAFALFLLICVLLSGCIDYIGTKFGEGMAETLGEGLYFLNIRADTDPLFFDQGAGSDKVFRKNENIIYASKEPYSKFKSVFKAFQLAKTSRGVSQADVFYPWGQEYFYRALSSNEFVMGTMGPNKKWNVRLTDRFLDKLRYGNLNIYKDDIFVRIKHPAIVPFDAGEAPSTNNKLP